ncbi:hypothetical protein [Thermogemmatispora tikiterensis]|nr:hypothetical protein [Thermogemmatispora tikiterensis]
MREQAPVLTGDLLGSATPMIPGRRPHAAAPHSLLVLGSEAIPLELD